MQLLRTLCVGEAVLFHLQGREGVIVTPLFEEDRGELVVRESAQVEGVRVVQL